MDATNQEHNMHISLESVAELSKYSPTSPAGDTAQHTPLEIQYSAEEFLVDSVDF